MTALGWRSDRVGVQADVVGEARVHLLCDDDDSSDEDDDDDEEAAGAKEAIDDLRTSAACFAIILD